MQPPGAEAQRDHTAETGRSEPQKLASRSGWCTGHALHLTMAKGFIQAPWAVWLKAAWAARTCTMTSGLDAFMEKTKEW